MDREDPGDTVPESNHPGNHQAHSGTGWEPVGLSLLDDLPSGLKRDSWVPDHSC